jgi:hypothetical protein
MRPRIKGRKRHIVTDTGGLLVDAEVHPADVQDRDGAVPVINAIHQLFSWLHHLFADSFYNGPNLSDALAKSATGTLRLSNARLTQLIFSYCHAAGLSNERSLGSIATAAWQEFPGVNRQSRAPKRGSIIVLCAAAYYID